MFETLPRLGEDDDLNPAALAMERHTTSLNQAGTGVVGGAFTKQIDGLTMLVQEAKELNPFDKALLVFGNRQRDKVKLLFWERNGFVVQAPVACGLSVYESVPVGHLKW